MPVELDLVQLIQALSAPAAYPYPVQEIDLRQTHISVVFLAGNFAYKIKKPVELGFLDFSTLQKRRHFCNEEVRLNRRLAPSVYQGVVPVAWQGSKVVLEGQGEVIEWAVKMERLPESATLQNRLARREAYPEVVEALGRKVAWFHAHAESGKHISRFGRFESIARNARENFDQSASQVGITVSSAVFEKLRARTEAALAGLKPFMERRADRDVPRDTHGDLRLDHVYLFPDRKPPGDLVIIDCIEFNERFRFADPVADMAFLAMDLSFRGRSDLGRVFAESYFRASGDEEGRALMPFYTAYRAAVRAKVEGFELAEKEIPEAERAAARARARAHWLLALGELEMPNRKPCLVLVGGLPGTGKSTLAQALVDKADFCLIRSDVVRKELAGLADSYRESAPFGEGLYSPEWNDRTYAECLHRAEALLFEGKRVLVDASFREEQRRRAFLEAAAGLGTPGVFLLCKVEPDRVRTRIAERRNDASDADWSIYQTAAKTWQKPGELTAKNLWEICSDGSREQAVSQALAVLRGIRLVNS
ncbi:MAG TPA: AAA family ATPase [Gemmataceae bacterium]|nr:AAA family ATPase [Gemmataceae bacterium]